MNYSEAVQNLKNEEIPQLGKDGFPNDNLIQAHLLAVEALKKQIPHWVASDGSCCICDYALDTDIKPRYCPECGQKLDWDFDYEDTLY